MSPLCNNSEVAFQREALREWAESDLVEPDESGTVEDDADDADAPSDCRTLEDGDGIITPFGVEPLLAVRECGGVRGCACWIDVGMVVRAVKPSSPNRLPSDESTESESGLEESEVGVGARLARELIDFFLAECVADDEIPSSTFFLLLVAVVCVAAGAGVAASAAFDSLLSCSALVDRRFLRLDVVAAPTAMLLFTSSSCSVFGLTGASDGRLLART